MADLLSRLRHWKNCMSYRSAQTGRRTPVMSGYGTTETAPIICTTHWATDRPGEIGLPAPGLEVKLIPSAESYELRVRRAQRHAGIPERTGSDIRRLRWKVTIGWATRSPSSMRTSRGWECVSPAAFFRELQAGKRNVGGRRQVACGGSRSDPGHLHDVHVVVGEHRNSCALLGWLNPAVAKSHATSETLDLHRDPGVKSLSI